MPSATSSTGADNSNPVSPGPNGSPTGQGDQDQKITLPVLTFDNGLPGFAQAHKFVVVPMEEELRPFCRMMSMDQEGLQFVVVPPYPLFSDYQIEIDEDTVDRLDLKDASDVVALLIVDPKRPPETPTVNLLAPVIFNKRTFAAAQVVLHGSTYSASTPLPRPPRN